MNKKQQCFFVCCAYAQKRRNRYISLWIENNDWLEVTGLQTEYEYVRDAIIDHEYAEQRKHQHKHAHIRPYTNSVQTKQSIYWFAYTCVWVYWC